MKSQDKRAWLQRYRILTRNLQRTLDEIDRWRNIAERTTSWPKSTPGGYTDGNRIENATEMIAGFQGEFLECLNYSFRVRREINKSIASLPDERLQIILQYHYIDGLKIQDIAKKMNYARGHVGRLHAQALADIEISY